jgi:hypothetical protein
VVNNGREDAGDFHVGLPEVLGRSGGDPEVPKVRVAVVEPKSSRNGKTGAIQLARRSDQQRCPRLPALLHPLKYPR